MPKRGTPYRLPIIYQNDVTPRGGSLTNTRRSISDRSATLSPPPCGNWLCNISPFPIILHLLHDELELLDAGM